MPASAPPPRPEPRFLESASAPLPVSWNQSLRLCSLTRRAAHARTGAYAAATTPSGQTNAAASAIFKRAWGKCQAAAATSADRRGADRPRLSPHAALKCLHPAPAVNHLFHQLRLSLPFSSAVGSNAAQKTISRPSLLPPQPRYRLRIERFPYLADARSLRSQFQLDA